MIDILRFLLKTPPAASIHSLSEWWQRHQQQAHPWQSSIDRALAGGFLSDRLGYAFASGYTPALQALVPALPTDIIVAFCVTEEGGAHPRALKTLLSPAGEGRFLMSGKKLWGTLAPCAQKLLVAASLGEDDAGQNRLKIALLEAARPGVALSQPLKTPFVPEIPHAEILFEQVEIREEDLLSGDGYKQYIKPFRTVEDIHVHAALLGYLFRVVRQYDWPHTLLEEASALVPAFRALALSPPDRPEAHLALSGLLRKSQRLWGALQAHWPEAGKEDRERWERDQGLFQVAQRAREKRLLSAWAALR